LDDRGLVDGEEVLGGIDSLSSGRYWKSLFSRIVDKEDNLLFGDKVDVAGGGGALSVGMSSGLSF
jgi:hypothetical protein